MGQVFARVNCGGWHTWCTVGPLQCYPWDNCGVLILWSHPARMHAHSTQMTIWLPGSLMQGSPRPDDSIANCTTNYLSFMSWYWNWSTYTTPLDFSPAFQHLLRNIHIHMVIMNPWPLRVIWYIQSSIHCCIFFIVTELSKQCIQSLVLSWLHRWPCCRAAAQQ